MLKPNRMGMSFSSALRRGGGGVHSATSYNTGRTGAGPSLDLPIAWGRRLTISKDEMIALDRRVKRSLVEY